MENKSRALESARKEDSQEARVVAGASLWKEKKCSERGCTGEVGLCVSLKQQVEADKTADRVLSPKELFGKMLAGLCGGGKVGVKRKAL